MLPGCRPIRSFRNSYKLVETGACNKEAWNKEPEQLGCVKLKLLLHRAVQNFHSEFQKPQNLHFAHIFALFFFFFKKSDSSKRYKPMSFPLTMDLISCKAFQFFQNLYCLNCCCIKSACLETNTEEKQLSLEAEEKRRHLLAQSRSKNHVPSSVQLYLLCVCGMLYFIRRESRKGSKWLWWRQAHLHGSEQTRYYL